MRTSRGPSVSSARSESHAGKACAFLREPGPSRVRLLSLRGSRSTVIASDEDVADPERNATGSRKRIQSSSNATNDVDADEHPVEPVGRDRQETAARQPRRDGCGLLVGRVEIDQGRLGPWLTPSPRRRSGRRRCAAAPAEKMISAGIRVKIAIAAILPHSVPVVVTYSDKAGGDGAGVEAGQRRGEQVLVPGEHPGQDEGHGEAGPRQRQDHLADHLPGRAAVDGRRLVELLRDAVDRRRAASRSRTAG